MLVTIRKYAKLAKINTQTVYARLKAGHLKSEPEDPETGIEIQLIDTVKYPPWMKVPKGTPVRKTTKTIKR